MRKHPFAVLVPAVAALAFAPLAGAATSGQEATSENWAGYVASPSGESTTSSSGTGFSAASGSWTQPTVTCSSGSQTYSAFWVGLGGGGENSQALEQEGTQADCSSTGEASYYAWYELVPSAPVKIAMTVKPGDKMWARTAVNGDQVTVEVDNRTTGQSFSKTLTMSTATPDTSTAEWVAEAPSECQGGASGQCEPLPLSDFGTVKFTDAYATSNGQTKSLSNWTNQAVELDPATSGSYGYGNGYGGGFGGGAGSILSQAGSSAGSEGATPGSVSTDGTAFNVEYGASNAATSTSTSTGLGSSSVGSASGGYGYSGSGYGDSGYGDSGYGYSYYPGGYGDAGGYGYSTGGGYGYGGYSGGYGYGSADSYGAGDSGYLSGRSYSYGYSYPTVSGY